MSERSRRLTHKDIAQETGFGKRAVSAALGNNKGILPGTAHRIRVAAGELGYYGERSREHLATCGVILPSPRHPFYTDILALVERMVKTEGIDFIQRAGDDEAREIENIRWFRKQKFEGVLLFNPSVEALRIRSLIDPEYPIIAVDAVDTKLKRQAGLIRIDTGSAMAEAAMVYLLGLGHKKISYISSTSNI